MTSTINVHILHTGSVIVDEALPFNYKYNPPLAWTGLFRSKETTAFTCICLSYRASKGSCSN